MAGGRGWVAAFAVGIDVSETDLGIRPLAGPFEAIGGDAVPRVKVHAAFLPQGLTYGPGDVCIVIDAVRAGATLVAMAEAGDPVVYLAADADIARRYRDTEKLDALLGGEIGGVAPAGFDFGNSPDEWRSRNLAGREVVFGTSNGTRAVAACAAADVILVGSFNNAAASARMAAAVGGERIKVVCAGSGGLISIDDAVCAGLIVKRLMDAGGEATDSGLMALALVDRFTDIRAIVGRSESARRLEGTGYEGDLDGCSRVDSSQRVPALAKSDPTQDRRLILV